MTQMTGRQLYAQTLYGYVTDIICKEISLFPNETMDSTIVDLNSAGNFLLNCLNNPHNIDWGIKGLEDTHSIYARSLLYFILKKDLEEHDIRDVTFEIEHKEKFTFDITISKGNFTYHKEEILTDYDSISYVTRFILNKIEAMNKMLDESL